MAKQKASAKKEKSYKKNNNTTAQKKRILPGVMLQFKKVTNKILMIKKNLKSNFKVEESSNKI